MSLFGDLRERLGRRLRGNATWIELQLRIGRIQKNLYYDLLTREVLRRTLSEDSVCVDVGSHAGSVLREMIEFAPNGSFLAVEPVSYMAERLRREFPGRNVRVFELALSDRPGLCAFNHVISDPALSGLVKRRYFRDAEADESIVVTTRTLDSILEELGNPPVRFVKVDVEGGELLVFRGATRMLRRDQPFVAFEHGLGATDCYGHTPEEVHDLLVGECRLEVSLLSDWLRNRRSLRREEFLANYYGEKHYFYLAHPRRIRASHP